MMEQLLYMAPLLLPIFLIQYWNAALIDSLLVPRFNLRYQRLIVCLAISFSTWAIGSLTPSSTRLVHCTLIYLLVPFIFYKGRILNRLLAFALWMTLYTCSEVICMVIVLTNNWDLMSETIDTQMRVNIICAIITTILYRVFHGIMQLIEDRLDAKTKVGLIITALAIVFISLLILLNACGYSIAAGSWILQILPIINALGIIILLVILYGVFSLVHQFNLSLRVSQEAHYAQQQAQYELEQTKVLIAKDQQYRQLRHDIKNHLLVIDALGQKGEYDRQRDYLIALNFALSPETIHSEVTKDD